jgi:hypothetical protein
MRKKLLGSVMAISLTLMPIAALADGVNTQLQPLNSYGYGQSNYTANAYNANTTYPTAQQEPMALRGRVSTVPKGTTMIIKLDQPLSSFSSSLGEGIGATLENDVFVNDSIAIPAGSEVLGQVTDVSRSSRLGKHGELDVRFHSVKTPDGTVIPIRGHVITQDNTGILKGNSYKMDIAKGIGIAAGSTGVGALAGTALGGLLGVAGTGAVFGTAVGGLAGISYAIARKGKDVVIPSGARVSIRVDEEVSVNY